MNSPLSSQEPYIDLSLSLLFSFSLTLTGDTISFYPTLRSNLLTTYDSIS
jgi:hypothetical protein